MVTEFPLQEFVNGINVFTDTDHAGCLLTRKSTTGFTVLLGKHTLRHGSKLQSTISLSSGESKFYGVVKGSAAGLGIKALLEDWGISSTQKVAVNTDSAAAKGMSDRIGLGRVRHVQTRYLWVQERVVTKDLEVVKVMGVDTPPTSSPSQ